MRSIMRRARGLLTMSLAGLLSTSTALACNLTMAEVIKPSYRGFDGDRSELMTGVGEVDLAIETTSPEAQAFFNQGVALLHGFWIAEARRSFETAAQKDPECPMCYWGILMSWPDKSGWESALKNLDRLETKLTAKERLYVEAARVRRTGEFTGQKGNFLLQSTEAFRTAMRKLVAAYPEDIEAKALLALALIQGYGPDRLPLQDTQESIRISEEILKIEPRHIGALHYLVHAIEPSTDYARAREAANMLPELAPNNPHLLHMPAHLHINDGDYDAAETSTRAAEEADFAYVKASKKPLDYGGTPVGHNFHTLVTALSLDGRYDAARNEINRMFQLTASDADLVSRTRLEAELALIRIWVNYRNWSEIGQLEALLASKFQVIDDWAHLAKGLAFVDAGELDQADAELQKLRAANEFWQKDQLSGTDLIQQSSQQRLSNGIAVGVHHLAGEILVKRGEREAAFAELEKAHEVDHRLGWASPPIYLTPLHRVTGNAHAAFKEWDQATIEYQKSLSEFPNDAITDSALKEIGQTAHKHQ
jgi:tetratricopeptide (TPR) repeat protein